MFEIRIHGRGGQGVVTAAELLAVAAFESGRHAQAFPSFGSERTGAPVMSFCRVDTAPIRLREPVSHPDVVIVSDSTLIRHIDVFGGMKDDGWALVNSRLAWSQLQRDSLGRGPDRVVVLPASDIANRYGCRPNAALLGGFAAMSAGLVGLAAVVSAILLRFSGDTARDNVAAASDAHLLVTSLLREAVHA